MTTKYKLYLLAQRCHSQAVQRDEWEEFNEVVLGDKIAKIHQAVSLMSSDPRYDKPSPRIAPYTEIEEQAALTIIRLFDYLWAQSIPIDEVVEALLDYQLGEI